jgi:translation initiation factor 1
MGKVKKDHRGDRVAYSEFGTAPKSEVTARPDPPAKQQSLKIQTTRSGRKGKTVTVISGFQSSAETLTDLAKKLKTQCGSGGAVKEQTIEIQGDHRQKLQEVLEALGYPVKFSGG